MGADNGGSVITDLINRRRDRAIGAILGVKERVADRHLPPEAARLLRKAVLDQVNDFAGLAADLVATLEDNQSDGVVLNELYLQKIAEIHDAVVAT